MWTYSLINYCFLSLFLTVRKHQNEILKHIDTSTQMVRIIKETSVKLAETENELVATKIENLEQKTRISELMDANKVLKRDGEKLYVGKQEFNDNHIISGNVMLCIIFIEMEEWKKKAIMAEREVKILNEKMKTLNEEYCRLQKQVDDYKKR